MLQKMGNRKVNVLYFDEFISKVLRRKCNSDRLKEILDTVKSENDKLKETLGTIPAPELFALVDDIFSVVNLRSRFIIIRHFPTHKMNSDERNVIPYVSILRIDYFITEKTDTLVLQTTKGDVELKGTDTDEKERLRKIYYRILDII